MDHERFDRAIAAIDAANADDPHTIVVGGEERAKEPVHAEMATAWVRQLVAEPSEELLLAARAHHIRRWTIPRSSYPQGRAGYLKWRKQLQAQHAEDIGRILTDAGYPEASIERVQAIIRKRGLGRSPADPEVQAFEDALCLVFIETQFHDVAARLDDEKMVEVVRKTLKKMSDAGREAALRIDLIPEDAALVARALEGETREAGT